MKHLIPILILAALPMAAQVTCVGCPTASGVGSGDVVGPVSSTANAISRFSGTGGKTLKNSGITIDDSNNLNVPGIISAGDGTVAGELVAQEITSNGTEYLSWLAPDARTTTLRMLLPTADPQAGQVMLFGAPSSTKSTVTWGTPILSGAVQSSDLPANYRIRTFGATFNGGGSALTAQQSLPIGVPYACTISAWSIFADAGTATVKLWKIATGTEIPTISNVINTSGIALATGTAIRSTTLTDFTTTAVSANDIVIFAVTAVSTATKLTVQIQCDL